jgi:small-conductance mechanosensitive channel
MILRLCCVLLCFAPLTAAASNPANQDSLLTIRIAKIDTAVTAPVVLANDTLFSLQAGLKGFSAAQRAEAVSRRILELVAESGVPVDSIVIVGSEVSSDIVMQDYLIVSIYDIDGSLRGTTRSDLAQRYLVSIRSSVERYREDRSKSTLIRGVIFSVGATIVLVLLLRILARARRWLETLLAPRIHGIAAQTHEILGVDYLRGALRAILGLVKWVIIAFLFYAYLEFVLTQFVWTRTLAAELLDLTLGPLRVIASSTWGYLPNFFFLLVLFILTRYLLKFLRFIFGEVGRGRIVLPGFYPDWAAETFKIARILVVAFALVVAFPYIPGSSSPAFQGVSIFLGVLFSFGSTSAVANVVAGVILVYMRSFKVGDIVKIQETVGTVNSRGLLVTKILTWKNVEVTLPNATVLGTHVINYSVQAKEGKLVLPTSVTIGYDAPWRQVHALLLMAAEKTDGVLKNPKPFVLQQSLEDFYVKYELNVHSDAPEKMLTIYSDLHQNIQDAFNEYGVQIMSPNYVMDRSKPTVVPKDKWFEPPAKKHERKGARR